MKFFLITALSIVHYSPFSFAGDLINIEFKSHTRSDVGISDQRDLPEGSYKSKGAGYLRDVRIKKWASEKLFKSAFRYGGVYAPFEMELINHNDVLHGEGRFRIEYTGGMVCTYPVYVELYVDEDAKAPSFYVKHESQSTICVEDCTRCWPLDLVTIREDEPYVLVQ